MTDSDLQAEKQAIDEQYAQQIGFLWGNAFQNADPWAAKGFGTSDVNALQTALDEFRTGLRLARTIRAYALKILNEPVDENFIPKSPPQPVAKSSLLRQRHAVASDSEGLGDRCDC
jgi:hypothetical protein